MDALTSNDSLYRVIQMFVGDSLGVFPRSVDRSFVAHVREVRSCERRTSRQKRQLSVS